jgi:hypothetical protein
MSSIERKMRRQQRRKHFETFTEEWNLAKRTGQLVNGKLLGKKPSFSQFSKKLDMHERAEKIKSIVEAEKARREADKNVDLEWKDEA